MKKRLMMAALIGLVLLTIILALANRQVVTVNYLFGHFRLPLILVIFGSVLTGVALHYLLSLSRLFQLKHEIKQLREDKRDAQVTTE